MLKAVKKKYRKVKTDEKKDEEAPDDANLNNGNDIKGRWAWSVRNGNGATSMGISRSEGCFGQPVTHRLINPRHGTIFD